MLKLQLAKNCLKFLRTLNPKQHRQVTQAVLELTQTPEPQDSAPLAGHPYRRVDVGEYRIIYQIKGNTLLVPLIGKRNDDEIYRALRRLL
ncbi:MAG: type II toxin-antitoxin system RelE/ParE family toxin [Pseudomonadota bacterium]|nr:type II toxin-antitoxin system RelE/ParE family toxin [Pseudomonadota bacterium]